LFNGDIIVNNNDGTLGLINDLTGVETVVASGGSRGDLVSPDLSNGTLLLDQYEGVLRLSCGANCSIGGGPSVPEPGTILLVGIGFAAFASIRRKYARSEIALDR
jgi:hypothetical protein